MLRLLAARKYSARLQLTASPAPLSARQWPDDCSRASLQGLPPCRCVPDSAPHAGLPLQNKHSCPPEWICNVPETGGPYDHGADSSLVYTPRSAGACPAPDWVSVSRSQGDNGCPSDSRHDTASRTV